MSITVVSLRHAGTPSVLPSPDWSHSRQVMASQCPELIECTSQGCSVSRMWISRVRSAGDGGQGMVSMVIMTWP